MLKNSTIIQLDALMWEQYCTAVVGWVEVWNILYVTASNDY